MTFDEFIKKYNGQAIDYDGNCGIQCVDLVKLYMDKVLNIKIGAIGNAEAYWNRYNELRILNNNFERITNTPKFVPQKGDIVVWGLNHGKYGHIAIADGVGNTSYFYSYDQNWNGKIIKRVKHTYKDGFEGVLRPKQKKYSAGQIVDVNIPIALTGAVENENVLVEFNKNQFWINKSVIKNSRIVSKGIICYVDSDKYMIQVLNHQFWCDEKYIKRYLA